MKENFNYSIWRDIEYKKLSRIIFSGKVLDLGGSKQERFLFEKEIYDDVLCINVLEHIYNFNNVFSEVNRVLKQNRRFILFTPFMYQIHGSPDDFFRFTESALVKLLQDSGFRDKV